MGARNLKRCFDDSLHELVLLVEVVNGGEVVEDLLDVSVGEHEQVVVLVHEDVLETNNQVVAVLVLIVHLSQVDVLYQSGELRACDVFLGPAQEIVKIGIAVVMNKLHFELFEDVLLVQLVVGFHHPDDL